MSLNFDDLIKKALRRKIEASPKKHSQKTPDCFSYSLFESISQKKATLTRAEEKHLKSCPYCQKFLAFFQNEVNTEAGELICSAFSDSKTIKKQAMAFIKDMIAPLDVESFESAWSNFFEKLFDWDKGEFKGKPKEQSEKLLYSGMGFIPTEVSQKQEDTALLLLTIAQIRCWILMHSGEESKKLKSSLINRFNNDEILKTMANDFLTYLTISYQ